MAASSSRDPMPAIVPETPSVQLWLPVGFDSLLVDLIAQESDAIHQGALSRCLEGLLVQIHTAQPLASQEVLSEASLSLMRFSQYQVQFRNGVDPPRCLCDMLHVATRLFDDELWMENAGMLESLPLYCSACDIFGHSAANCIHYYGHSRTEGGFVPQDHISGKYKLEKLGRTVDDPFLRVIDVRWFINSPAGTSIERRDGGRMFLWM